MRIYIYSILILIIIGAFIYTALVVSTERDNVRWIEEATRVRMENMKINYLTANALQLSAKNGINKEVSTN